MITNKQLQEFLSKYSDDAEVVLQNGLGISHVGMISTTMGGYKIILANKVPTHYCNVCGDNIHKVDGRYYCHACNRFRNTNEMTPR